MKEEPQDSPDPFMGHGMVKLLLLPRKIVSLKSRLLSVYISLTVNVMNSIAAGWSENINIVNNPTYLQFHLHCLVRC